MPVLALTATATDEVTRDIIEQLAMADPACFRGRFFRPNLHISAYRKGDDQPGRTKGVRAAIARLVEARRGESGIIYALSRKACDSLAEFLRGRGVRAAAYHAGLAPATRTPCRTPSAATRSTWSWRRSPSGWGSTSRTSAT